MIRMCSDWSKFILKDFLNRKSYLKISSVPSKENRNFFDVSKEKNEQGGLLVDEEDFLSEDYSRFVQFGKEIKKEEVDTSKEFFAVYIKDGRNYVDMFKINWGNE